MNSPLVDSEAPHITYHTATSMEAATLIATQHNTCLPLYPDSCHHNQSHKHRKRGATFKSVNKFFIDLWTLVSPPCLFQFGATTKPWSCHTLFSHLSKQIRNQINTNRWFCWQHLCLQTMPCDNATLPWIYNYDATLFSM